MLPTPIEGSIIYEDDKLYVCLANYPITNGHSVVIWKDNVPDIHLLDKTDYEYLMDIVDHTRNAMIKTLNLEKIYLMYMDEIKHVHWHLIPRYDEQGYNIFKHEPKILTDISLAAIIKSNW